MTLNETWECFWCDTLHSHELRLFPLLIFARSWQVLSQHPFSDRIVSFCRKSGPDLTPKDRCKKIGLQKVVIAHFRVSLLVLLLLQSKSSHRIAKRVFKSVAIIGPDPAPVASQVPAKSGRLPWCCLSSVVFWALYGCASELPVWQTHKLNHTLELLHTPIILSPQLCQKDCQWHGDLACASGSPSRGTHVRKILSRGLLKDVIYGRPLLRRGCLLLTSLSMFVSGLPSNLRLSPFAGIGSWVLIQHWQSCYSRSACHEGMLITEWMLFLWQERFHAMPIH